MFNMNSQVCIHLKTKFAGNESDNDDTCWAVSIRVKE